MSKVLTFRSSEQACWFAVVGVGALVGMTLVATTAPADVELAWRLLAIAIGASIAVFLIRGAIRWSVKIDDSSVVIRGVTRTVRLPKAEIEYFELRQEFPYTARAIRRNGASSEIWAIAVPMVGQDEKRSKYEAMIDEMNAALTW